MIGQPDLTERGKAREVEKLYARARAGKGAKKAKPTRAQREHGTKKGPRLDARLRADQRQARGPCRPAVAPALPGPCTRACRRAPHLRGAWAGAQRAAGRDALSVHIGPPACRSSRKRVLRMWASVAPTLM